MYAVEFETDVVSEYVRIPNFEQLKNQHVKVIVLSQLDPIETKVRADATYLDNLRKRNVVIPADVNVDALMTEMNDGLS